jgi:hypothetical protein
LAVDAKQKWDVDATEETRSPRGESTNAPVARRGPESMPDVERVPQVSTECGVSFLTAVSRLNVYDFRDVSRGFLESEQSLFASFVW